MSNLPRPGLTIVCAIAALGCDRPDDISSKPSVTVQLPPARPYVAEPGFSLATEGTRDPVPTSSEPNKPSRS
jgi:hypothetical protein